MSRNININKEKEKINKKVSKRVLKLIKLPRNIKRYVAISVVSDLKLLRFWYGRNFCSETPIFSQNGEQYKMETLAKLVKEGIETFVFKYATQEYSKTLKGEENEDT